MSLSSSPAWLVLFVLLVASPCRARRQNLQRFVSGSGSGMQIQQYGHVVRLKGFAIASINTKFRENLDPSWNIAGHSTYWSSKYFVYYCATHQMWCVVANGRFAQIKKSGQCFIHAALQKGTAQELRVARDPTTTHAFEVINKKMQPVQGAGIVDVSYACGAFIDEETCRLNECVWSLEREHCAAHYNVLQPYLPLRIDDIAQGELGTCYFLAVLASLVTRHSDLLENRFVERWRWESSRPAYTINYLIDGEPTLVSVDDAVPVSPRSGDPAFVGFSNTHLFWPSVVEKSWAKIFGNYKAIEGGLPVEALKALTQAPVDIIEHDGRLEVNFTSADLEDLWVAMKDATYKGFPMITASDYFPTNGMAKAHCYAVIAAKEIDLNGTKRRALHVFNPWGRNYYEGDIPNQERTTGHFLMTLEEYSNAFFYTAVAAVQEDYKVSTHPIPLETREGTAKIRFHMPSDKPFTIMLHWPSSRLFTAVGCTPITPDLKLAVAQPASASKTGNSWGQCERILKGKPSRCHNNVYATFCRKSCNDITMSASGLKMEMLLKAIKNSNGMTMTGKEHHMGLSNVRANFPGAKGEYNLEISAKFREKHGQLINKITLVIYAEHEVTFEDLGSSLLALNSGSSLAQTQVVNASHENDKDLSQTQVMPEECLRLYNRLSELNNWEQIMEDGNDVMFPQAMRSIAKKGEKCGDAAQGISEDCSRYDHWRTFYEIMRGQVGSVKVSADDFNSV